MDFDFSNMTIPIATLLGASWLFTKESNYGWLILVAGFIWWSIDQIVKWQKMDYIRRHG